MRLQYEPFPLVRERGDATAKLAFLAFFGLGDSPQARECLLELIRRQRSDGAFPSQLDSSNWGMRETVRTALLLLEVGLPPEGVNVNSAASFILKHQNPDGGWCENRALKLPPERTWLSNQRSITWLTADVVDLLCQVGMGGEPVCQSAVEWLKAMQKQDGSWPSLAEDVNHPQKASGDPDSTAQIAFLMGEICGEQDSAYLKGRRLYERYLDECAQEVERGYRIRLRDGEKERLDVYHLTHLFLSWLLDLPRRIQSGYDRDDPRVKEMMKALVEIQREDGGWRPFWSERSCPTYTVLAVKVLSLTGAVPTQVLKGQAEELAG